MNKVFKLANAPNDQPLTFDLSANRLFFDKDAENAESAIDIRAAHSVAAMKSIVSSARPEWLVNFFGQMNGYVQTAHKAASIDENGQLALDPRIPKSGLREVCNHLAWLYEMQYRQNKEILLWIGEIILDFMARSTKEDMTIEEAIESLGLLDRENGVKWKMKTLARWPVVVQRIPAVIRQLPIPPTYLSEAALFAQPEDLDDKIAFNNARDALLVAVSDKPDSWSRSKFVACMKELQDQFGMERMRNEGVSALQERLISYYRIQRQSDKEPDRKAYLKKLGLDQGGLASWIYNIECELQLRGKLPANPEDNIPRGDGLTAAARERVKKAQAAAQATP